MKVKISITLSEDVVIEMTRLLGRIGNRSVFVEEALRHHLATKAQQMRDARDLEILNRRAPELNQQARDVLSYQAKL